MKRFLLYGFLVLSVLSYGQTKDNTIAVIDSLSRVYPNLNNTVVLSIEGMSIGDVVSGINRSQNLNIGISKGVEGFLDQSFNNVKVRDILYFICQEYDLEILTYGDIIFLEKSVKPIPKERDPYDFYTVNQLTGRVTVNVNQVPLEEILKATGTKAGVNLSVSPKINNEKLNLFLKDVKVITLLEQVASLSENVVTYDSIQQVYSINPILKTQEKNQDNSRTNRRSRDLESLSKDQLNFKLLENDRFELLAQEVSLDQVIKLVSNEIGQDYFLLDDCSSVKVTCLLKSITFEDFIRNILAGTDFKYVKKDGAFVIGSDKNLNVKSTEFFQFENRSYENVLNSIPEDLKDGLQLKEFPELNGIIINGNALIINRLLAFLKKIDRRVPMISIDIIIIDYSNSRSLNTGIELGFGPGTQQESSGTISPGIDISLNSSSINKLLDNFEKSGLVNIGRVTPNFYMGLQLLESEGVLKTRSTPKITTLNGQSASLSLGRTEYYLEIQNNIIGTQNPTVASSQNYRSVNADLSINIKPVVSSDDQVTLEITVNQSDFTNRINENAPPGTVNRTFESIIRVKNDEMVILGGLEDMSKEKVGSGIPILNRIPILKYFFGKRSDSFSKSKLNVLIKPTIYY